MIRNIKRKIKTAYGAGWRAGVAPRRWVIQFDGIFFIKIFIDPVNPFTGKNWFLANSWDNGQRDGAMKVLKTWLQNRGGEHAA